ncbi:MAG TPA: M48 family metallopeptidase [Candidatus Cloacimonadota bacterium]|nr:M48 family metallopeptidase [Candidatus Cloacimonadota bacterium]HQL14375.1 M48 family metallopeptidase [Candidatus Cloacimonadota bacterium]
MPNFDFNKLRYAGEVELVHILEDEYAMKSYYDIFDNREDLENITNQMLANTVKLNKVIAPRLYNLCAEIQKYFNFKEPVDFYLFATSEVNAFSINGFGIVPHIICFTSSLVQQLNDDELRFVIGHELGHLIYKHSQLDVVNKILANRENEEIPTALAIYFLRWQRYAEVSCDRIGYLAVPDIKVIGTVFFKFASGLNETYLNFNIDEYLKQLDKIKKIAVGDFFSTHPNNLVRLQNLRYFSQSVLMPGIKDKDALSEKALLHKTNYLMNLLEIHPKKEKDKRIVEFYSSVGVYLAQASGDISEIEWKTMFDWLANYTTQPEIYLKFKSKRDILNRVEEICKYFSRQHGGEKYELFEKLTQLAIMEGRLEQPAKDRLYEIGKKLKISKEEINHIIRRSTETYLNPSRKTLFNC